MAKAKKQKVEQQPVVLDESFQTFYDKIDRIPEGKGKGYVIGWGIASVVLIVASSLLFMFNWLGSWIPAIVGTPAGVILFLLGLGIVHKTGLKDKELFQYRQEHSFKSRLRTILVVDGLIAILLIAVGTYIPYGVGGAFVIVVFLTSIAVARKTPYELELSRKGLLDPRDLEDGEDKYADETTVEGEEEPDADNIIYQKDDGSLGGRINS